MNPELLILCIKNWEEKNQTICEMAESQLGASTEETLDVISALLVVR